MSVFSCQFLFGVVPSNLIMTHGVSAYSGPGHYRDKCEGVSSRTGGVRTMSQHIREYQNSLVVD